MVVDQDTDLTTLMVTIHVVNHTGVEDNLHLTNSKIMLIDINHMLPGDQVVMEHVRATEVQEVVKVS